MLAVIVSASWKVTSSVLRLDIFVVWFYCRKVKVLLHFFYSICFPVDISGTNYVY